MRRAGTGSRTAAEVRSSRHGDAASGQILAYSRHVGARLTTLQGGQALGDARDSICVTEDFQGHLQALKVIHGKQDSLGLSVAGQGDPLMLLAYTPGQRPDPPAEVAEVLTWVARNSAPMSALAETATARRMLDQATGRLDGKTAAASTARRNRTILANAMDYAVELGLLETNPIRHIKWTAPRCPARWTGEAWLTRGRREYCLRQRAQQPSGPRLMAFFAVMYYAGLRPEEAINLATDNVILPAQVWDEESPADDEDSGELHIHSATPDTGSEWTDDGSPREKRQLKHRAEGDSRIVPVHPELTRLLRDHIAQFATTADGRLFSGVRGGELPTVTYRRAWSKARQTALTAAEQASPLARRPYDLRHACLSTWLNGGVYPTQAAEWAGYGVDVLLRIYAKCVAGQDELAKRRISDALL